MLENNSAYAIADQVYQPHFAEDLRLALLQPYKFGKKETLAGLFLEADLPSVSISTIQVMARFPDVRSMVLADLEGWLPCSETDSRGRAVEGIIEEMQPALEPFIQADGAVEFLVSAHLAIVTKGCGAL